MNKKINVGEILKTAGCATAKNAVTSFTVAVIAGVVCAAFGIGEIRLVKEDEEVKKKKDKEA